MNLEPISPFIALLLFPGGISLLAGGLFYEWLDRKFLARFQNRIGPRWFQPLADIVKLLSKEEVTPEGVNVFLFRGLPIVALAGALTAALYVPIAGFQPSYSFEGDLIVALYLLSLLTLCLGLAGANTVSRFSLIGATRTLTQLFSYEAPFLLALLGPALAAGSWKISQVNNFVSTQPVWMAITQPIGFFIALVGLMGKLEMPPFDAPEAETEIVAGALTEYSGRGFALFRLGKNIELVVGLTLMSAFYLGGVHNPIQFALKTFGLLVILAFFQSLFARLKIDQVVGLWWRIGALLALVNIVLVFLIH